MRLYIAGGIAAYKDDIETRIKEFDRIESILQERGYSTINPFDVIKLNGQSQRESMDFTIPFDLALRFDLIAMLTCDGLALMDDWRSSRGARLEVSLAAQLGMEFRPAGGWKQL